MSIYNSKSQVTMHYASSNRQLQWADISQHSASLKCQLWFVKCLVWADEQWASSDKLQLNEIWAVIKYKMCNSDIYYSPAFVVLFVFLTFSDGFWGLQFPKNFPGGSAPLTPRQGLRPWTPLGAAPPDPCRSSLGGAPRHLTRAARYLLTSLASSLPPPWKILPTALHTILTIKN